MLSVCSQYWKEGDIPPSQWLGEEVARQSSCELEVDAVAVDILNRMDLKGWTHHYHTIMCAFTIDLFIASTAGI